MTISFVARSPRVESAENALKKAIKHFLIIDFNFPNEALDCIANAHIGLELLIKEFYFFNGYQIDEVSTKPIKSLIEDFQSWDNSQKQTAHWLRHKRNQLTHSGVAKWAELHQSKDNIQKALILIGDLYLGLDYQFEQVFSKLEVAILSGLPLDWREQSKFLGIAAYDFIQTDPETALQIANKAFEISFRGYAISWEIDNSGSAPLLDLYHCLMAQDIISERDFVNIEQFNPTPFYFNRDENEEDELYPPDVFFFENIRSSDIDHIGLTNQYGSEYKIRKYIDHINEASQSYSKRAVNLPYARCFLDNFQTTMCELLHQFPSLKTLKLDEELGVSLWNYDEFSINIHFDENKNEIGWNDDHKSMFMSIIEKHCGKLPDYMEINIIFRIL